MNIIDCTSDSLIINLSSDQRRKLIDLVEVERKHASHWWAMLNEMRCRNELPSWVKQQAVGTELDHNRWLDGCAHTNNALFGRPFVCGEANQQMFRCNIDLGG
jgi:hypothetical protein